MDFYNTHQVCETVPTNLWCAGWNFFSRSNSSPSVLYLKRYIGYINIARTHDFTFLVSNEVASRGAELTELWDISSGSFLLVRVLSQEVWTSQRAPSVQEEVVSELFTRTDIHDQHGNVVHRVINTGRGHPTTSGATDSHTSSGPGDLVCCWDHLESHTSGGF